MSRSLKKGPFVADHLLSKIEALNIKGDKQWLKPGLGHPPFCPK
jgi:small subunit ribosomal protein S19